MHTGLYLVRATGLKQRLEAAADSTANKLLDQIQTMARDSNDRICETYNHMSASVAVVSSCHKVGVSQISRPRIQTVTCTSARLYHPEFEHEDTYSLNSSCFGLQFHYEVHSMICDLL